MLYSVITVVLVVYVCVSPYFYAKAVKFGIKIADKPEKTANEPIFHIGKPRKDAKMTPEEKRKVEILENALRYDGTPNGQKEIVHAR